MTPIGLGPVEGGALTALAVAAVRTGLLNEAPPAVAPESAALRAPGAAFVTLERRGRLRGCVGSLRPTRPLYLDVVRNARYAMVDPRLPAVTRDDWPELDVKISVLGPPEPLPVTDLAGLVAALRPGVDGLLLADTARRATFLPSVWSRLTEPERFVAALLTKGGWPTDRLPDGVRAHRYGSLEFHDPAPRGGLPLALGTAPGRSAAPRSGVTPAPGTGPDAPADIRGLPPAGTPEARPATPRPRDEAVPQDGGEGRDGTATDTTDRGNHA